MKVFSFKFTFVAVIAVTIALSHLNPVVAINLDNNIDYVQQHHLNYVEREHLHPQDDEIADITAMDYEHPQIPGVDSK